MRRLLKTTFLARQHRLLIILSIIAMIFLTFASQLEVVALGMITRKGPDFFELFAPMQAGKLLRQQEVNWEDVSTRWQEIDRQGKGTITKDDATHFLSKYRGTDLVESATLSVNRWFPISSSLKALALFILLVAIFKATALFAQRFFARLIAIRISRDLRQAYFEHIQTFL